MRTVIDENFLANLELFSLAVKDNVAGLFGGNHKSKRFGSSSEFADYREYIEGDDISKIDWNIYGRSEKMFLKLYLDERQMQTRIYIDASNSMGFYKKDEMAIKLATAFAYLSIKEMDRVSIFAVRGNIVEPILEKVVGKDSFLNVIGQINKIEFGASSPTTTSSTRSTIFAARSATCSAFRYYPKRNYIRRSVVSPLSETLRTWGVSTKTTSAAICSKPTAKP